MRMHKWRIGRLDVTPSLYRKSRVSWQDQLSQLEPWNRTPEKGESRVSIWYTEIPRVEFTLFRRVQHGLLVAHPDSSTLSDVLLL